MTISAKEVSEVVRKARVTDSFKKKLILHLAKARSVMTDADFEEFFTDIKTKLEKREKELN